MTVSFRQTQDPQEQGPQYPQAAPPHNAQAGFPPGAQPGAPQRVIEPTQRKVMGKVPQTPFMGAPGSPGGNGQAVGNGGPPMPVNGVVPPGPMQQGRPAQMNGPVGPVPAGVPPANAGPVVRQPAMLRTANGQAAMPVQQGVGTQRKVEIENGNIILYRTHNFFLRTAYRPERLNRDPLRKPTGNTTMLPRVMLDQNKRIANSETRVMPSITLDTNSKTRSLPIPAWLEAIFVMVALGFTTILHAYNMFNFPRYELDEGTYMANAWAITQGLISPYPYGYGHPPLAWIQIGGWLELTGGVFTFGNALNSGRVLMLLYAVASALLVYLIVRRFGGSRSAALLALVVFAMSPLSITYQRQVFLDNIATFWMLVALYLLVSSNSRIVYLVGSALAFGCAVLSKEVLLICFPAFIYAAWLHITKFQRKFALVTFIYGVVAACSTFVLLAVLKGELFPYAWHLPWDTHQHLSLLDTLVGQVQRSESNGSFIDSWTAWLQNDPVFVILSLAAPFFNLVYGWWNRKHLMLALLAISFWILLIRGGQVLSFYILPLIPLIALNVAIALNAVLGWFGKLIHFNVVRAILLLLAVAVLLPYDITSTGFRFYQQPTSAQQEAMLWVRNHVPHNSFIVINSYLYLDLRVPGGEGLGDGAPYPHAEVYWNVAFDPEIHDQTLQNNWDRIDYIVADSEMEHDIENSGGGMDLIKQALDHSILRAQFSANDHNLQIVISIYQVQHKVPQPVVNTGPVSTPAAALFWQGPPGIGVALADRRRTG